MSAAERREWSRWAAPLVTLGIALCGLAVHGGVVLERLSQVEKRIDTFIAESAQAREKFQQLELAFAAARAARQAQLQQLERRLSAVEGLRLGDP